jgi:RNA polymerase sigma-70 factor (ECF subfamily)
VQNDPFTPSDAEIVREVLDGNVNAFESLLTRYRVLVLKIVSKHVPYHEIDETTQNAFVRAYRSLSMFEGKGDFGQWLASIAVRTCYDYWRKAYRSREVPMSTLTLKHQTWLQETVPGGSEHSADEVDSQRESREILDWALSKLPVEDRIVLELIYLEGLSCKEAADLTGWSVANVKVRSFRSRKKLEKALKGVLERERREAP